MKAEPSIFEQFDTLDPQADERRIAEARADIAAGRVVANEDVIRWLETWGTAEETPAPDAWLK